MTVQWRILRNTQSGEIVLGRVRLADNFWSRFRGLQLVNGLPDDEGLLFVGSSESRAYTTIHMFFMLFSIGVVWLDASGKVVDTCFAKPWRPAYAPRLPAQYFIEANPNLLERVKIGDILRFDEATT